MSEQSADLFCSSVPNTQTHSSPFFLPPCVDKQPISLSSAAQTRHMKDVRQSDQTQSLPHHLSVGRWFMPPWKWLRQIFEITEVKIAVVQLYVRFFVKSPNEAFLHTILCGSTTQTHLYSLEYLVPCGASCFRCTLAVRMQTSNVYLCAKSHSGRSQHLPISAEVHTRTSSF